MQTVENAAAVLRKLARAEAYWRKIAGNELPAVRRARYEEERKQQFQRAQEFAARQQKEFGQ